MIGVSKTGVAVENDFISELQANNYSNGNAVYWNGIIWDLAQNDNPETVADGIIKNVSGTGFDVIAKKITITAHGLGSAGQVLYVSQSISGELTTTKPTTGIIQPVARIYDANTLIIHDWQATKAAIKSTDLTDFPQSFSEGDEGKVLQLNSERTAFILADLLSQLIFQNGTNTSIVRVGNTVQVNFSGAGNPTNPFPMTIVDDDDDVPTPSAGTFNFYALMLVGRPVMSCKDSNGNIQRFLPQKKSRYTVLPFSSSSLTGIGAQPSTSTGITHTTDAVFGYIANCPSPASANQAAQVQHRGNTSRIANGIYLDCLVAFVENSAVRMFAGVISDTNVSSGAGSDNAAFQDFGFHYSTTAGDTEIMIVSRDSAGNRTRVGTGMAFAVNNLYRFYLSILPGSSTLHWRIENLTAGTKQKGTKTTNFPDASTALRGGVAFATTEAVAKNLIFKELNIDEG